MALRLAGEEFSIVQGLDDQGWLEKTAVVKLLQPAAADVHDLGTASYPWQYLFVRRLQNPGTGDGGAVFVDDALTVMSNLKLGGTVTNYSCLKRPMTNRNAARTMQAGEVVKLDTANDQSVVDTTGAAQLNPFVVVDGEAPGNDATVAVGGVCTVNCDTAAVSRGDLLVASATALQATVDNTMADGRKILGIALSSKSAGAAGSVLALIKTL